jgi:hypothetical protein
MKKTFLASILIVLASLVAYAQENGDQTGARRVALNEVAMAPDGTGAPTLEATLRTTSLSGAVDTPVTNTRFVVKNVSQTFFTYVAGVVTFYDGSGVRCGEGQFKADVLAPGESVEVDSPGVRIRCSPSTWRIVANDLVPRSIVSPPSSVNPGLANLTITIDGEEHPIQLDRPMVVKVGDTRKTIVVRQVP